MKKQPLQIDRRTLVSNLGAATVSLTYAPAVFADSAKGERWAIRKNYNSRPSAPTQTRVITDPSVRPMLTPQSLRLMQDAISRYQIIVSRGGWPRLARTRSLVPGSKGKHVRRLRQRLAAEGYLPLNAGASDRYDAEVKAAVARYQENHGLRVHGHVGRATQEELSVSAQARLEALRANLPRVQEYSKNLGLRYIVVNIPATQLDAVYGNTLHSRHNIVAGKQDRPSPVLASRISELNFNPYWNAPVSIVQKDLLPQVRKNVRILDTLNIKIFDGYNGPEVDPSTVDWRSVSPDRYHFRQDPGENNAMASVKINFPNKYAVYMHDTPTKQLFSQSERYFSSGCVRVDQVHVLTDWILNGQEGWNRDRIGFVAKSGERLDVKVFDPPELRFAYLTAWVTDDSHVHFRPDIYNLDGTGFVTGQPRSLPSTTAG